MPGRGFLGKKQEEERDGGQSDCGVGEEDCFCFLLMVFLLFFLVNVSM